MRPTSHMWPTHSGWGRQGLLLPSTKVVATVRTGDLDARAIAQHDALVVARVALRRFGHGRGRCVVVCEGSPCLWGHPHGHHDLLRHCYGGEQEQRGQSIEERNQVANEAGVRPDVLLQQVVEPSTLNRLKSRVVDLPGGDNNLRYNLYIPPSSSPPLTFTS